MKNNTEKTIYLPGLNGIRAIASVAVVISHVTLALADFNLKGNLFGVQKDGTNQGYRLAGYGVSMFFVLSGFLITYLLQFEADKQEIDIRKFYIRRLLRIWPLYYLYLLLCLITIFIFGVHANMGNVFYYIFFAANVPLAFGKLLPFLAHFWSLGVEEQFYLFWPWIIKKIRKSIIPLLITLIAIQNIIRIILWYDQPHSPIAEFSLLTRFDCMMIGGVGAILYKRNHNLFLKVVDNKLTQAFALFVLGIFIINKYHTNAVVDNFTLAVITLIIIVGQINKKNRLVSFDNPVFDFLGKISFGIYVYHPLLIFYFSKLYANIPGESIFKYLLVFGSVLGAAIVLAYCSYVYFESWFIKLKSKFTVIKSSGFRVPKED